jgi:hypothetical protein
MEMVLERLSTLAVVYRRLENSKRGNETITEAIATEQEATEQEATIKRNAVKLRSFDVSVKCKK